MKMKKKVLSAAVIAAMGAVGSAQAVHVNPEGTGQVLLFPYYTVLEGNKTLISVVNTTNRSKAVKIRFLDAKNTQEVLDFNIYLSPEDVWVGSIQSDGADGAVLATNDTTCTAPYVPNAADGGVPFRNLLFSTDQAENDMTRVREGYIEIIEMGEVDEAADLIVTGAESAILHDVSGANKGHPHDYVAGQGCPTILSLWQGSQQKAANGADSVTYGAGTWRDGDPATPDNAGIDVTVPTGGLFGSVAILNVDLGVEYSENATALQDFFVPDDGFGGVLVSEDLHSYTGSLAPSLAQAEPPVSNHFLDGMGVSISWTGSGAVGCDPDVDPFCVTDGLNAVSALLMAKTLANEWTLNPAVGAETSWVVTFPTKRPYVQGTVNLPYPQREAIAPFIENFNDEEYPNGSACERALAGYWDREEQIPNVTPTGIDFSPQPEQQEVIWDICWEANVINFGESDVFGSAIGTTFPIEDGFKNGWGLITFSDYNFLVNTAGQGFSGLPAVGFAATRILNNEVGVGAAYAATNSHRRVISSIAP